MLQMRGSNSYTLNKNVLSLRLNMSSQTSHVRSSAGRLFHVHAVSGGRNCGRRSSSWCGEQPVDRNQQTADVGRRHGSIVHWVGWRGRKYFALGFKTQSFDSLNRLASVIVGGVAQWLGHRSLADGLSLMCIRTVVDT